MRLIYAELYKLFSNRFIKGLLIVVFAVNMLCVVYTCRETGIPTKDYVNVMDLYRTDPDFIESEYDRISTALNNYIEKYMETLESKEEINTFAHEFNYVSNYNFTDWDILGTFFEKKAEIENYENTIESYIEQAEKNKNRLQVFQSDASYSLRYQDAIISTYQELLSSVHIEFDYIHGWDTLFSYNGDVLILFITLLFMISTMIPMENTSGMTAILSASSSGRRDTAIAKIIAASCVAVVVTILIRMESFAIIGFLRGYSNPQNAVQMIPKFVLCPFAINCMQLFLLSLALLIITTLLFSMTVLMISSINKSALLSVFGGGLFQLAEFAISKWNISGNAKYLNIFSAASSVDMFSRFRAFPIGNRVIDFFSILLWLSAIAIILSVSVTILFFGKKPQRIAQCQIQSLHKKISSAKFFCGFTNKASHDKISKNENHFHSICIWEIRKQERVFLLIAAFMMIKLIYCIAVPYTTSYADTLYYEYMTTLAGPWSEEKEAYIDREMQYINDTLNAYDDQFYRYRDGKLTGDEYSEYLSEYRYALARRDSIPQVQEHSEYLKKLKAEYNVEGYFLYDTGFVDYIFRDFDLVSYGCVLLLCCQIFTKEYQTKTSLSAFSTILRTTGKGREITYKAKKYGCLAFAFLMILINEAILFVRIFFLYGIGNLNAPLCSIEKFGYSFGNITVCDYLILIVLIRVTSILLLAYLCMSVSLVLKKGMWTYAAVILITIFPHMLTYFGISVCEYIDYCSFLSANDLFCMSSLVNEIYPFLYAVVYIIIAVIVTIAIGKYAKRRYCR